MGQDVQLSLLVIEVGCSHIIVIITDGKTITLCHAKSCLKGLERAFPVRLALHIRHLLTVNPAQCTDILYHFFPVGINKTFNFFPIHRNRLLFLRSLSPASFYYAAPSGLLLSAPNRGGPGPAKAPGRPYRNMEASVSLTSLPSAFPLTLGIRTFIMAPLSLAVGFSIPISDRTALITSRICSSLISSGANSL